eukprot:TRINITY_DN4884_c0_g3_i4.p1 TRINITY_DN4884_c0_g3~~TRINITY_DN4884_c0_g3_i4.p1  ORF type:complete len:299 (-),score=93.04 TRINITY_DN4884_c0_g3_i4:166-1062(-)
MQLSKVVGAAILGASALPAAAVVHQTNPSISLAAHRAEAFSGDGITCGKMIVLENAETKLYADSQKTTANPGDKVAFKCNVGFTIDGTAEAKDEFEVVCGSAGFYEPKGACLKAPKCGKVPAILHAKPTGKIVVRKDNIQYACSKGYSLDGKQVGAAQSNNHFEVVCNTVTEEYEKVTQECKAYAYMPAAEAYKAYMILFETLFKNDCAGKIKTAFSKQKEHDTWGDICKKAAPQGGTVADDCKGLVDQLKTDFGEKLAARKAYYDEYGGEGEGNPPNLNDEAKKFCKDLWGVIKVDA